MSVDEQQLKREGYCWTCKHFRYREDGDFACVSNGSVEDVYDISYDCKKYVPYIRGKNVYAVADCRLCTNLDRGVCEVLDEEVRTDEIYHGWCDEFSPFADCIDPKIDREDDGVSVPSMTDLESRMKKRFWRFG